MKLRLNRYALVRDGQVVREDTAPRRSVSGWLPIRDVPPFTDRYHEAVRLPMDQWVVHEDHVEATYAIEPLTEDKKTQWRKKLSCGPRQFRLIMREMGLTKQVKNFVATLDEDAQEDWAVASEIQRMDPLIVGAAKAFGLTDEQMDDLILKARRK
mgnify:CR=1 FL=1